MNIAKVNYSPAFRGVNLVQVSKKAFGQSNLDDIEQAFRKMVNEPSEETKPAKKKGLFAMFKKREQQALPKTFTYLETPGYTLAMSTMKDNHLDGWPIDLLSQRTDVPLQGPLDSDYYSFYVLTGTHRDKAFGMRASKEIGDEIAEAILSPEFAGDDNMAKTKRILYTTAKITKALEDMASKIIKGADIQKYTANSAEELEEIVKKIDYSA